MSSNPITWLLLLTSLFYDATYTWMGNTTRQSMKKRIIKPLWLFGWIPNILLTASLIWHLSGLPMETTKDSLIGFTLTASVCYGWICWLILRSDFKRPN